MFLAFYCDYVLVFLPGDGRKERSKIVVEKETNERTVFKCCVYLNNKWILISVWDWSQSLDVFNTTLRQ